MNTPLPPNAQDAQIFNDRQRRQLGQVYSLILSWRREAKQNDPAHAVANKKPKKGSEMAKISNQTE